MTELARTALAGLIDLSTKLAPVWHGQPVLKGAIEAITTTDADARRYRYLRSRDLDTISQGGVFAGVTPANMVINGLDLDRAIDEAMGLPAPELDPDVKVLRAALRSMMAYLHGLCCFNCKAQGRELNKRCCKDADCDAGFYGVDAEAIAALLELGEALMPGTLAEIETAAPAGDETGDDAAADFTARRCERFGPAPDRIYQHGCPYRDECRPQGCRGYCVNKPGRPSHEDQGTGFDSGASGYERQGRKATP